jgi:CubicO group peptidase (beta-lactamase class C family)
MTRRLLLLAGIAGAALAAPDLGRIDAAVEASLKAWGVPGASIAIVKDDRILVLKGYGVKENGKSAAVTPDTVFAIGSTTKAFTTAALAILADEGKLDWDDPVRKHVPEFRLSDPLADQLVTLRDLVCHRTGLTRHDVLWHGTNLTREELIRRAALLPLSKPFRSVYQYQNIMFLVAGTAVGRAAGSSYEEFVQRRILDPLGMKNTNFSTNDLDRLPDRASPHVKTREGGMRVVRWRNLDNIGPAGSINSSAADLARWMRMQLNGGAFEGKRIISEKNLAEMHTAQVVIRPEDAGRSWNPETNQMAYGLAWTLQDYRGLHLVSHGGAIDGFRANITLVPKQRLGIAVLANLGQENMPEALRYKLIDAVLGLAARDWDTPLIERGSKEREESEAAQRAFAKARRSGTRPAMELSAYAAVYRHPAYGEVRIGLDSGQLTAQWAGSLFRLEHHHFETFLLKGGDRLENTTATFYIGPMGSADTLHMLGVEFQRVK